MQILACGTRYEGAYHDDLPDGPGTMTRPDGKTYSGIWHHGCLRVGNSFAGIGVRRADCS